MIRTALSWWAALFTMVPVAAAQDPVLALDPTTMVGYAGTVAADQHAGREFGGQFASRSTSAARPVANPAQALARLNFRPNSAVRQKVFNRAVTSVQRTSPKDAAKLRQQLSSGAVHRDVACYLSRYGMSVNNVADTTALYLASAWFASRASSADPTPAQMRGFRMQVASVMATMPSFMRDRCNQAGDFRRQCAASLACKRDGERGSTQS